MDLQICLVPLPMKTQNNILYIVITILLGIIVYLCSKPVPNSIDPGIVKIQHENAAYIAINNTLKEKIDSLNFKLGDIELSRKRFTDSIHAIPVIKKIYLFKKEYGNDSTGLAKAFTDIEICKTDLEACGLTTNTLKDIISANTEIIKNQASVIKNDSLIDVMRITEISLKETQVNNLKKKNRILNGIWKATTGALVALTAYIIISN